MLNWINFSEKERLSKNLLSIDLDYFNYGNGNIHEIIQVAKRKNNSIFWTYFHDYFLDIANRDNIEKIINYDSHDDVANMEKEFNLSTLSSRRKCFLHLRKLHSLRITNNLLEGTWVGLIKDKSYKTYFWKHNLENMDYGRCEPNEDVWSRTDFLGFKKIEEKKTNSFNFSDIEKNGILGICVSPDYTHQEIIDDFMMKYCNKYSPTKLPTRR